MKIIERTFIPGSSWIYIKLYTGHKTADDILLKSIALIIKELHKKNHIEKWFFIRYADADFHLRVRLLARDARYVGEIIQIFHEKLYSWSENRLIWKIQLDTYNRELERYGKNLIEEAESVFYADSKCMLSIIQKLGGNENYRWMIALRMIESLLSDFRLSLDEKQKLMENLNNSYKTEFGFNEFNSKQFNTKFRENKPIIESVLNNTLTDKKFAALYSPVKVRSKDLLPVINQIRTKMKKQKSPDLNDLLKSYLHMMLNRLFLSKNRLHELVLYDFMRRYYTGEIAKLKYKKT